MEFGEILRELLAERELSQKELAADLNIAPSTLGNYIRGLREPDFSTLKMIAAYFNVSTDYLLGNTNRSPCSHNEERLLRLLRSMDAKTQAFYLQQGVMLLQYSKHQNTN